MANAGSLVYQSSSQGGSLAPRYHFSNLGKRSEITQQMKSPNKPRLRSNKGMPVQAFPVNMTTIPCLQLSVAVHLRGRSICSDRFPGQGIRPLSPQYWSCWLSNSEQLQPTTTYRGKALHETVIDSVASAAPTTAIRHVRCVYRNKRPIVNAVGPEQVPP
jgi:hypothetical protein